MPLHYAIRALLAPELVHDEPALDALLSEVEQYLKVSDRDKDERIRQNIKSFRQTARSSTAGPITERAAVQGAE
jgi:hypothetical protein